MKNSLDRTLLTELLQLYSDADEIVFKHHCQLDEQTLANLCREARHLAHHLRLRHANRRVAEVARALGIEIVHEEWEVAEGQIIYLAECSWHPPRISLNAAAIGRLAEFIPHWGGAAAQAWFTRAQVSEVAIAHELYHLVQQNSPRQLTELAAHAFARAFTDLPFSSLLYGVLLTRFARGKRRFGMS
jgi:hypothetical protein